MFNIGSGEIALIAVAALLILGPKRLPELARGIGKFMREFRRQTDEVRGVVEREFYKMDQDLPRADEFKLTPRGDSVAQDAAHQAPAVDPGHAPDGTLLPGFAPDGTRLADATPAPTGSEPTPTAAASEALPPGDDVKSQVMGGMPAAEPTASASAPATPPSSDKS